MKKIWDDCKCPIYVLVDADPYGIEIMLTYRHGSKVNFFFLHYCFGTAKKLNSFFHLQNLSFLSDDLAIPSIQWIGVYPSEIKNLNLQSLPLTKDDVYRINDMIKRPYINTKIYQELLVLQNTKQKTEVEALTSSGIGDWIDSYLLNKIQSGTFI